MRTYTDIDAENLNLKLVTDGRDILLGFIGTFEGEGDIFLNCCMDGKPMGDDYACAKRINGAEALSFVIWKRNVPAGAHKFSVQYYVDGSAKFVPNTPTNLHCQFWAREV